MSKKTEPNKVWFLDLCANAPLVHKLSKAFKNNHFLFEQWHKAIDSEYGIVLFSSTCNYEELISILNIQMKHRNYRIVVLNNSPEKLIGGSVLKILNYGAEYFYEIGSNEDAAEYIIEKFIRWRNIEVALHAPAISKNIIGGSAKLIKILRSIIEVGLYSDVSVMIQGERGTGKESIAKLIHELDQRKSNGNLILVDCTTIRTELSGSEFFGHEKGSYTNADHTREGAFALANNGTLFLDEVGETPLLMQAELLRVIQEGVYKKLGSNIWKQTNFRLVCATNRDLLNECTNGFFRKDLYDRISMWSCYMPALHERKDDIPLLMDFFLKKNFQDTVPVIDDSVMQYLMERDYPGNIRELKNLINRISVKYVGKGPITLGDVPEQDRITCVSPKESWYENASFVETVKEALQNGHDAKKIMDTVKSMITKIALASAENNKEVSQLLGRSERWIQLQKAKEK